MAEDWPPNAATALQLLGNILLYCVEKCNTLPSADREAYAKQLEEMLAQRGINIDAKALMALIMADRGV